MIRSLSRTPTVLSFVGFLVCAGGAAALPASSQGVVFHDAKSARSPNGVDRPATSAKGVIEGRLLDEEGRPVPGLDVVLTGQGLEEPRRAATESPSGAFRFDALPLGVVYVLASGTDDGVASARASVTLDDSTPAHVDLRLKVGFSQAVTVTGTREAQLKRETPATVGTVTRARLEETRPSHPSEVMNDIPGVWVNTTSGEGHMTAIRQPLTTNPVYLYLEDGVPTRSAGFFNHNALYEVNLAGAEGIEVTKGPGSALYGSDAVGGVVNVITRSALQGPDADVQVEGGGFGWRRVFGGGALSSPGNGVRATFNVTHSDGWRDATGYDRHGGTARWDHAGAGSRWKALVSYSHVNQQTAGSSTLQVDDYRVVPTRNLTPISFRRVRAFRASAEYERAFGPSTLSVIPYTRDDEMGLLANWTLTFDPTVSTTRNNSYGVLAKATWDVSPMRTQILVGFDLDISPGGHVENQIQPGTTTTSNGKTIFSSYTPGAPIYDYGVTFAGASPYAQVDFSPTARLRASVGLRYDSNRFIYHDNLSAPPSARYQRPADTTRSYGQASPKLGLTYLVSESVSVFASYRHAFRAPSEAQLFRQGSTRDTVDLQPVRADNFEIGVRSTPFGAVSVQASAYRLEKRDDILSFRNPVDGATDTLNAGRTRHQGVEVGIELAPRRWVNVNAAYSYARHTYVDWVVDPARAIDYSGREMELGPRNLGHAAITVVPSGRVTVAAEMVQMGRYWMDAANTAAYGGHTLFNLRGQVAVGHGATAFARVLNVGNRPYAETSSYTLARGPELAPGRPRTLFAGFELGWKR